MSDLTAQEQTIVDKLRSGGLLTKTEYEIVSQLLTAAQQAVVKKLHNNQLLNKEEYDIAMALVDMNYMNDDPEENINTAEVAEQVGCSCGNHQLRTRTFWLMQWRWIPVMHPTAFCDDCGNQYEY